jgi:membrane protease YdiL (CAAX protease family)
LRGVGLFTTSDRDSRTASEGYAELPPWGLRECVLGLAAVCVFLVLAVGVVSIFAASTGHRGGQSVPALFAELIATLLFEAALVGIAVALTAGKYKGGLALLGWRVPRSFGWLRWSLFALVLSWFVLGAYAALTNLPGLERLHPKSNVPQGVFDHAETLPLAIFLTVVAAPVAEETFFRGFLFNGLRRRLGFALAASVSGVLFAIFHAQTSLIIPFTVIGVIFAFTYYRTGTLLANVTTHFVFNLVSVIFALAAKGGNG